MTLLELNSLVSRLINTTFSETYWITSEVSDVRFNRHCYLEFVQKSDIGSTPVARARGTIWMRTWMGLKSKFERVTGQPLSNGMQVMVEVEVNFDPLYGYSLNVVDINPSFTLGDIARRRQEIISRLKADGIYDLNRKIDLPRLITRVAVISAEGAAGYQDFCNQLDNNKYNLKFHHRLFPAIMQGENTASSIISALDHIAENSEDWDLVIIIRGGGSTSDLQGFDSYELASNIAQFPIPVITGIGHERDNTVIDEVAHTRVKTPTAAAEFLISHQYAELNRVMEIEEYVVNYSKQVLLNENNKLARFSEKLPTLYQLRRAMEERKLDNILGNIVSQIRSQKIREQGRLTLTEQRLKSQCQLFINSHKSRLEKALAKIDASSPEHTLRLGYSITRLNGLALTSTSRLRAGDQLHTTLADGIVVSTVNQAPAPSDEDLRRHPMSPPEFFTA